MENPIYTKNENGKIVETITKPQVTIIDVNDIKIQIDRKNAQIQSI